jgi:hypothetical protein
MWGARQRDRTRLLFAPAGGCDLWVKGELWDSCHDENWWQQASADSSERVADKICRALPWMKAIHKGTPGSETMEVPISSQTEDATTFNQVFA